MEMRYIHTLGPILGRKQLQPRNYFCIFYWFEVNLCRMVELRIPKNPVFCFSILTVFGGKIASQGSQQVMAKQIKNFERAWRDGNNCEFFWGESSIALGDMASWNVQYVSKNSNIKAGNSKIKAW